MASGAGEIDWIMEVTFNPDDSPDARAIEWLRAGEESLVQIPAGRVFDVQTGGAWRNDPPTTPATVSVFVRADTEADARQVVLAGSRRSSGALDQRRESSTPRLGGSSRKTVEDRKPEGGGSGGWRPGRLVAQDEV